MSRCGGTAVLHEWVVRIYADQLLPPREVAPTESGSEGVALPYTPTPMWHRGAPSRGRLVPACRKGSTAVQTAS